MALDQAAERALAGMLSFRPKRCDVVAATEKARHDRKGSFFRNPDSVCVCSQVKRAIEADPVWTMAKGLVVPVGADQAFTGFEPC
nr:hypothetical protein [uncultured Roseateles sp.]